MSLDYPLPWPRIPIPYLFWMLSEVNLVLTLTFNLNYWRIVEDLCSRWSLFHMESIRTLINLNLHIHWDPYHSPEFMPPPSFSHYYFQLCISLCIYTILFYSNLDFTDRRELLWWKDWLCQSWHILFLILPLTLFSMFYIQKITIFNTTLFTDWTILITNHVPYPFLITWDHSMHATIWSSGWWIQTEIVHHDSFLMVIKIVHTSWRNLLFSENSAFDTHGWWISEEVSWSSSEGSWISM